MEDEGEETPSAPPQPPGPVAKLLGCLCLFCGLFYFPVLFLVLGYNSDAYKAKGTAKDFVSIGKRCRVEAIDYQANTVVRSTSDDGTVYGCDEIWNYDFVVLETEGVLDAEIDADYFGLRTVREQRPTCQFKSCHECSTSLLGKYALNEGQVIEDGHFATECWSLKEGVEANSFWDCSELYDSDTSCYLLNDPKEILNAHVKAPRKRVIAGWFLFAFGMLVLVVFGWFVAKEKLSSGTV